MGTSAFDRLWDTPSPVRAPATDTQSHDALDAVWDAPHVDAAQRLHDEYRKGLLGKRMARENQNDADSAAADDGEGVRGWLGRFATHVLSTAQGIPGVEAVEAAAGAAGSHLTAHPLSYEESLKTLRSQTDQIPTPVRVGERMVGSLPLAPFLPASGLKAGALLGAADEAFEADPNVGLESRGKRALGGALVGGAVGKLAEGVTTGARAIASDNAATQAIERLKAPGKSAGPLYDSALADGYGNGSTEAVKAYIEQPDVASIIGELQRTREFANVAGDSPKMLDAVYKVLSDRGRAIDKGLEAVSPNRPNIGRFRKASFESAQQGLLDAMETPGSATVTLETAPAPKPTTREALQAFRDRQTAAFTRNDGTIDQQRARAALERHSAENVVSPPLSGLRTQVVETPAMMSGYRGAVQDFAAGSARAEDAALADKAMKKLASGKSPPNKDLTRTTPEAIAERAKTMPPDRLAAAMDAVLGRTKMELVKHPFTSGRRAAFSANELLQHVEPGQAAVMRRLALLLGLNATQVAP